MRNISVTSVITSELEEFFNSLPDVWKQFRPFLSPPLRRLTNKVWLDLAVTHAVAVYTWGRFPIVVVFEYNEIEQIGEFQINLSQI